MKDKTALIVGAADDVGAAISIKLAENGAKLILIDSDLEKLNGLAGKVEAQGTKPEIIAIDPGDSKAVKSAIDNILRKYGSIDILVNNIDHVDGVPVAESTLDAWSGSLNKNLVPLIVFSLNVIPAMKKGRYGRIVFVGSIKYLGTPAQSNYCTAKSAIFGMTRSLAMELARDGITVNQVIKGSVKSSHQEMTPEAEAKAGSRLPVQRLGRPEDIAHAVAYFASERSQYVTGQNLFVCGGESLYSSMSV